MIRFGTAAFLLACAGNLNAQPSFQRLGILLGGSESYARGISADGLVVVGESDSTPGTQAVRKVGGTLQGLGFLLSGDFSDATAVSGDGAVVVGFADDGSGIVHAFRWSSPGGMVPLPGLPGTNLNEAFACSLNGQVVVGLSGNYFPSLTMQATRTSGTSTAGLGFLTGFPLSAAFGVSGDGSVVVGIGLDANSTNPGNGGAFWWTSPTGMQPLPGLVPGGCSAHAVSSNGRVAVGMSFAGPNQTRAVRWRSCGNGVRPIAAESLGVLGTDGEAVALAVSATGSVIVGKSGPESSERAFIWEETTGMRDVRALAQSIGLNLNGWALTEAIGVSGNGRVIVGNGRNPQGANEGWILNLGNPCFANCDGSTVAPILNANDFLCFLGAVAAAQADPACHQANSYANCDGSTAGVAITANDFQCFLTRFASGCS